MRKFFYSIVFAASLAGMMSCGGKNGGTFSGNENVEQFAETFIGYVNANQLDSMKAVYPSANFDAVAPLESYAITVAEIGEGSYKVNYTDDKWIEVLSNQDGTMTVMDSQGIAFFPEDKVEIAKKTGMWQSNLSDTKLAERMNDEDFFNFISKKNKINPKDIIIICKKVSDPERPGDPIDNFARSHTTLINSSDVDISGSDYMIKFYNPGGYWDAPASSWTNPGKNIPAHGKVDIDMSGSESSWDDEIVGIKWNLSDEDLKDKFASPYTGNEYQEYLNSK